MNVGTVHGDSRAGRRFCGGGGAGPPPLTTKNRNQTRHQQCMRRGEAVSRSWGRAPTCMRHRDVTSHFRVLSGSCRAKERCLNVGTIHGDSWAGRRFCRAEAPDHLRSPRNMKTGRDIGRACGVRPYFNEYRGTSEKRQADLHFEPRKGASCPAAYSFFTRPPHEFQRPQIVKNRGE